MAGLKQMLDPARLGMGGEKLERDLCDRVVGQAPAIGQIVRLYQTILAGLSTPGANTPAPVDAAAEQARLAALTGNQPIIIARQHSPRIKLPGM